MNEPLKEFSLKVAAEIKAALATQETEDLIKTIKASGDDRTFEVVMSTSDEDRQGDELDQSKWELKYFTMNPVLLWAHNYSSFPIGIVTDIKIEGNKAIASGKFAPAGVNPDADMACTLYQAKVLRAVSPGYIQNDDGTRELLEVSFCPVPAGRYALSMRQVSELGISTQELVTKGYFYDTKGAVAYKDLGTAEPDEAWDSPAEVKACGEDMDKLKSICAWFDSEDADVKSSYKLPHHRASDLKAVWNGVKAAAAALQGGRGGVDIPSGDIAAVKAHIASHYKEFGETPPWEKKSEKTEQAGDTCELEDATPGTLTENPDNPGTLVCVPNEKSQKKSKTSMNEELTNKFKAEHERHQKAFAKAIDEFKDIDEFGKSIDGEQDEHLEKTMKAIDEGYELQDQKKSIDEFKSAMSAEHLTHVKACDKAVDEFKASLKPEDGEEDKQKSIDEFTKAIGDELDRHEKAHKELCEAEFGGGENNEEKSAQELITKIGRQISAKNKEKLKAILQKMESHHNDVTAALKELIGPEDGGGGEEPSDKPKDDESEGEKALNSRSSTSGATAELETYLFTQRLVRQVKTASEGALRQINEKIREARSSSR